MKLSLRVHVSKQFHTGFLLTLEFTAGGHRKGFTTGQQKHVTLSRTPYLEAYVESIKSVLLISIIHHKLCKGAIEAQNQQETQIKHAQYCSLHNCSCS